MSLELLANQLLPETLKEDHTREAWMQCNPSDDQIRPLEQLLLYAMTDGIATGLNMQATQEEIKAFMHHLGEDTDIQASEIDAFHRGFLAAIELLKNRGKE